MSTRMRPLLRIALFTLGGAFVGLALYFIVGCPDGSCAITSSPLNSMVVVGFLGFFMSGGFCGCTGGSCSVNYKKPEDKDEE